MSNSDSDFFLQQMADVTPLKQDAITTPSTNAKNALNNFYKQQSSKQISLLNDALTNTQVTFIAPDDYISFKSPGLQAGVFKNLRLAKYDIDAKIELQGLSIKEAQDTLINELTQCHRRNIRVVLIKHGVGKENSEQPAKMKSYVNAWLVHFPFVLGFHTAQTHHGGYGAVYVLLSKNEQAKLANREIHAKK
ncbi:DNA endonuclease SmrA [Pseudoalteromonas sp. G4]|uniref:DNA endonuclease SmrA n=1 Tax=Pseudoalteromonas sp. G4 TaxID=2992761 RepID=UPI00237D7C5E|nr:DNA endonuclease SmrA [Pseudoalteromonas sp. G4]MDE3273897.1 DNA endonuclease SmrA [Pseudoalteromonas sp. G4]